MPLNPNDFRDLVAVIYARVSQDKSKNLSVPAQVQWGREQCERFGWPVAKVITDTDIGATRHSLKVRPGYLELPAHLVPEPGKPRRVLVTRSSSRANRQLGDFADLRDLCAEHETYWYSGGQLYDLDNPQDRRILANEAVENEYGPEQSRFDSMQQLSRNFADGKPHGKEAFGYRIAYERGKAVARVIDEGNSSLIREMTRRAISLESTSSIARWLTSARIPVPSADMALPCRKCSVTQGRRVLEAVDRRSCPCDKAWMTEWDHIAVRNVLLSPTIAGLRGHKDRKTGVVSTTPAQWEAIISVEERESLLRLFASPGRRAHNRGSAPRWLLSGIPRCGKCTTGRIITHRSGANRPRTYECENYCVARDAELVDALVEETVLRKLEDPELLAALERSDAETQALAAEAKRARAVYEKWIAEAIQAELSPLEIKAYKDAKLPAVKQAEARAQAAMPMPHVVAAAGPDARDVWHDADRTPLQAKRDIIRSLLSITLYPAGKKRGFGGRPGVETIDIQPLVA
ncbi:MULTISPECIES: recombinase family protein [Nocardia]|uniref:recombinase family protein n=1 Tax=Nocardia TaxID=1817 RepID=UPI000D69273A|nr:MULTISPECIES: recombinase family protein [Nocardia]